MKKFTDYLDKTEEIGFVEANFQSLVHISGLPEAHPHELVVFESGELGQVFSLKPDFVEVILLSPSNVQVGTKVARTGEVLQVGLSTDLLGKTLDSLGRSYPDFPPTKNIAESRPVDITPTSIANRKKTSQFFETGISWVDLVIPIGKGQRELVIGDRKTGKTPFLMQIMLSRAKQNTICVYTAIAKRRTDIKIIEEFIKNNAIEKNSVIVASAASDPSGLIFLAPYTAMTIAEYFRDQGHDVLIILDDMIAHAKHYRELSLLSNRFPGRSSYPGDIFYVQSRLLERAGNFINSQQVESSITCLPVAELVMGDLSGYIPTNLMSSTDGHILFDGDLYNQGRRPAINPFLSVTRVGHQTQSPLLRDTSRELTSFLVHFEKLKGYIHFGAELSEATKRTLHIGDQTLAFLSQSSDSIIPLNINVILLATIWAGFWKDNSPQSLKQDLNKIIKQYQTNSNFTKQIDELLQSSSFSELVTTIKAKENLFTSLVSQTP